MSKATQQNLRLLLHLNIARTRMLLIISIMITLGSYAGQPLPAAETTQSSAERIHQQLRDANPVWYDRQNDHWQRGELPPPEPETKPGQRKLLSKIFFSFVFVTIIALFLYIAYLIVNHLRSKKTQRTTTVAPSIIVTNSDLQHLPVDHGSDSSNPLQTLRQAAAQQDWNKVVVYCLVVLLVELHRAQLLSIRQGKTNGDYLREIQQQAPQHAAILQRSIHSFETSYFGHHRIDSADAQALTQQISDFVALLSHTVSSAEPVETAHA